MSKNMSEELIEALKDVATQVRLLREDLRPELKKSAIFKKKNEEKQQIKEDALNFVTKRFR